MLASDLSANRETIRQGRAEIVLPSRVCPAGSL